MLKNVSTTVNDRCRALAVLRAFDFDWKTEHLRKLFTATQKKLSGLLRAGLVILALGDPAGQAGTLAVQGAQKSDWASLLHTGGSSQTGGKRTQLPQNQQKAHCCVLGEGKVSPRQPPERSCQQTGPPSQTHEK